MLISEQWADALERLVRIRFEQGFARRQALSPHLFNVQNSLQSKEQISGVGAIGIDAWEQYEKDGSVPQADFDQGYKSTFTHKEKIVEIAILRKLLADSNWPEINNIPTKIGDSAALKREVDGASVFNNSESASFLGADAVALLSNSHPLSPAKPNSTQDNLLTKSLTKTNLGEARETMMAFTDDNTELVAAMPNLLLVPPELEDTAIEITASERDPDSATNKVNPQAGRFQVVVWHHLTDANKWYVIDTNLMNQSLFWFDREPLTIVPKVEDKTWRATWIAYMRYSFGWADWRWVIGSNPS